MPLEQGGANACKTQMELHATTKSNTFFVPKTKWPTNPPLGATLGSMQFSHAGKPSLAPNIMPGAWRSRGWLLQTWNFDLKPCMLPLRGMVRKHSRAQLQIPSSRHLKASKSLIHPCTHALGCGSCPPTPPTMRAMSRLGPTPNFLMKPRRNPFHMNPNGSPTPRMALHAMGWLRSF